MSAQISVGGGQTVEQNFGLDEEALLTLDRAPTLA